MKSDTIEKKLEQLSEAVGARHSFVNDVMNRIENCPAQPGMKQSRNHVIRRIQMKTISKYAAAALIILGVSAVFLFNSSPGSIALAEVYSKVRQVQAFMYTMSMTINGEMMEGLPPGRTKMNTVVMVSADYGMKLDTTVNEIDTLNITKENQPFEQVLYLVPDKKSIVSVVPSQKIYQNIEFSDDLYERLKKQNCDPREMIKQMLACDYTDLGRSEIDGVKVQGFETSDPAYSGGVFAGNGTVTLWVDINTWLPVQSEMKFTMEPNAELSAVISDFQWNLPVTAEDFQPVIPGDYTSMGSMKVPEISEEKAIEGLRFYADLFGRYPAKIDLMSLIQEASQKIASNPEMTRQMAELRKSEGQDAEAAMSQLMQKYIAPVQSLGMFYMSLVQDKQDPAYFGNQVSPDDKDMILMRWKIEGDTYNVVFGDLTTVHMQHDDLIQVEPEPLVGQQQPVPNVSSTLTDDQMQGYYASMKNIKQMVMACYQYSQQHDGQWPDDLKDLIGQGLSADVFVNPTQPDNPDSYVYIKPTDTSSPAKTVVIYETYDTWNIGVNVGFLDGHVEFIRDEQQFKNLLSQ